MNASNLVSIYKEWYINFFIAVTSLLGLTWNTDTTWLSVKVWLFMIVTRSEQSLLSRKTLNRGYSKSINCHTIKPGPWKCYRKIFFLWQQQASVLTMKSCINIAICQSLALLDLVQNLAINLMPQISMLRLNQVHPMSHTKANIFLLGFLGV